VLEENIENTQSFIDKPEITSTASRANIENEKKLAYEREQYEEYLASASYYNNTNYNNTRNVVTRDSAEDRNTINIYNPNSYYYGYCTWYVATVKNVPSFWGNAGQWLYSATNSGYATGQEPANGAIIVTNESGWGHVGIVESVGNGTITISEMNYSGWGVVNTREINIGNPVIQGFIY